MTLGRKVKRVPGDGSLYECRHCKTPTRDPAGHLVAEHFTPTNMGQVWESMALLSTARKPKRPVFDAPEITKDQRRLF